MREIKFRAWWRDAKLMAEVEVWRNSDVVVIVPVISKIPGHSYERQMLEEEQYDLMQYTGLKDKNGKEIWEGDIVRTHPGTDKRIKFLDTLEKIEFKEGSFIVQGITISHQWNELYKEIHRIEIIGNIYENPELIPN